MSTAGVIKRRCELILPWVIFQSVVCGLFAITLFVAYAFPNGFFLRHMGTIYYCRCEYWVFKFHIRCKCFMRFIRIMIDFHFVGLVAFGILFTNIICLMLVFRYYKGLKMLKRLTEEVIIPIPYRAVSSSNAFFRLQYKITIWNSFFSDSVPFPQGKYVCWKWRL